MGATYVILAGGFDLSVAAGFAFCAVVAAALAQKGIPASLAFLAAIVAGVLIGGVNAALVVGLQDQSICCNACVRFCFEQLAIPYRAQSFHRSGSTWF